MVGKYHVEVYSKRNKYVLDVKRKYTFISGESGSGKSKLSVLLKRYAEKGRGRIHVNSPVPVEVIDNMDTFLKLCKDKSRKAIYVIDETFARELEDVNSGTLFSRETEKMSAYFVIMSRSRFGFIPHSPLEIYDFERKSVGDLTEYIMVNHYVWEEADPIIADNVIVEDAKVGYLFFKETLSCHVESAYGNGNIQNLLQRKIDDGSKTVFIIADGAAFGCSARKIFDIQESNPEVNIRLFCPESFEYLVLKSNIFNKNLDDRLVNTFNYAETSKYFSWERYFTELLGIVAKDRGGYKKDSDTLPSYLLSRSNISKIYSVIREVTNA